MVAEEGTEVNLRISEPIPRGSYKEIVWYRIENSMDHPRIAEYNESLPDVKLQYIDIYCSDSISTCETSKKAELNISSGDLKIYPAELSDSGIYYYHFNAVEKGISDTGYKYETLLEVYSK